MQKAWENTLNHKTDKNIIYDVYVERLEPYKGQLVVELKGKELMREDTHIGWDAKFGPDMDDVQRWSDRCIKFVDEELTEE